MKLVCASLAWDLNHLAVQEGQLSSGVILGARASQLYARRNDMRRDLGLRPVAPLKVAPSGLFGSLGVVQ